MMPLGGDERGRITPMKTTYDLSRDPLVQSVEKTMTTYRMLQAGDRVLVGLSGGPDSTAVLLCLHQLAEKLSISLQAAHLNHGLRGDRAAHDARQAAGLAAAIGIPFVAEACSVEAFRQTRRMSLEEAAREVRYRFLERAANAGGFNRIALGHHRDDDAELILMRFLRGSGPLGLAGIPPQRSGSGGAVTIIRPFIRTPRLAILAFLKRSGVTAVEDESNADVHFLRNRIRHQLLPLLTEQYNPDLAEGLSRMAHLMRDEEDWLSGVAVKTLQALTLADHGTLLVLDRKGLAACHPALQRRVLRAAVQRCKGDLRRMGFAPLEAARELATQGPAWGARDMPDGLVVRGQGHRLDVQRLSRKRSAGRPSRFAPVDFGFEYRIPSPGRFSIREAGVTMAFSLLEEPPAGSVYRTGQQTAFFDMDQLRFPLTIRNFRPGDRLAPLGLSGTQKVKKIFIDRKIAREDRPRYPLLLCGDQILWVVGLRQSGIGKIGPTTTRWLKVEMTGCLSGQDGYF
jgi:tRNA(Ile)-lysidine synthase